jgi:tetratricopeptide (TPR) repeat protein
MKKTVLILCIILILCSVAGILLETRFAKDLRVQRLPARFLTLSDQQTLDAAHDLRDKATPESLREAIVLYREALSRDSENPYRWDDLGRALLDAGRIDEAQRCYRRAVELGPNDIQNLYRVMNFQISIGQPREALRQGSHILEKSPYEMDSVFQEYLQSNLKFPDTLTYGIPAEQPLAQAYMRYVIRDSDSAKVEMCWDWIISHAFADDKLAGEYLNFMIRIGRPEKARDSWSNYLGKSKGSYLQTNLLYNPGFESDPLPIPFDWKILKSGGAEATRDSEIRHDGKWSLHIAFDGKENPAYRHVNQYVFLDPGMYLFKGFLRADGITTEQGIGFRIGSSTTEQIIGTTDWKELAQTIEVREPSLLRLEVFRNTSRKIDNKLSGTVWVDDLELIPIRAAKPHR